MHVAETHRIVSHPRWKQAWRAGCAERYKSGSGKGDWKRIEVSSRKSSLPQYLAGRLFYETSVVTSTYAASTIVGLAAQHAGRPDLIRSLLGGFMSEEARCPYQTGKRMKT